MNELADSIKLIRNTPNDRLDMMLAINALVELVAEMRGYIAQNDFVLSNVIDESYQDVIDAQRIENNNTLTKADALLTKLEDL